jgi:O-antigen/teichoic acid export membrane protein
MTGRRLSTQALIVAGCSAVGQLAMVGVLSHLGRGVGPDRLGVVASSIALAVVLAGLIDFGANTLWIRELASGRLSGTEFGARSAAKLLIGGGLAVVVGVLCLAFGLGEYSGCALALASVVLSQTLQVALRAEGKNFRLAVAMVVDRGVLAGTYFLLRTTQLQPEAAFFTAYLCGAAADAAYVWSSIEHEHRPLWRAPAILSAWRGSRYFGVWTILNNLQSLDIVAAAAVGGAGVAGTYGAVNKWSQPISLATNAFSTLLLPVIASAQGIEGIWQRIRGSIWLPLVSVATAGAMAALAKPVVLLLMGSQFTDSVPVLQVLCLATALSSLSQPLVVILQGRNRDRLVARGMAAAVALQFAVLVPLVRTHGALGLSLAGLIAQSFLLVILATITVVVARRVRVARYAYRE